MKILTGLLLIPVSLTLFANTVLAGGLNTPNNFHVTQIQCVNTDNTANVTLSWDGQSSATAYKLYKRQYFSNWGWSSWTDQTSDTSYASGIYSASVQYVSISALNTAPDGTTIESDKSQEILIDPTYCQNQRNIAITAPNGGEYLYVGQTYRITWNSSSNIDKVSLGYSTGPGSLNWIATNIPNTGYYDWTVNVGNTTNTQYKIEIIGYQTGVGSIDDESDHFFTVSNTPNPIPSNASLVLNLVSNTSGNDYKENVTLSWNKINGAIKYNIYQANNPKMGWGGAIAGIGDTSYTVVVNKNLDNHFKVSACFSANNCIDSNMVSIIAPSQKIPTPTTSPVVTTTPVVITSPVNTPTPTFIVTPRPSIQPKSNGSEASMSANIQNLQEKVDALQKQTAISNIRLSNLEVVIRMILNWFHNIFSFSK